MTQKNLVAIIITLGIGLGIGFTANRILQSPIISNQVAQIQKLQSQIAQAKKFFPPLPSAMSNLSGTVKSVSGNTIVLDANLPNPFVDLPTLRTIRITNKTVITMLEQKDPTTFRNEYMEFQKKPIPGAVPPNQFRQTAGTMADLMTGQSISVTGSGDISAQESFDALSIQIIVIRPTLLTPQSPALSR